MAKRGKPGADRAVPMMVHQDKHERMLSEMHDALYTLGNKIRKPMGGHGEKLLPKSMQSHEAPEAKAARSHIEDIHTAMKKCRED